MLHAPSALRMAAPTPGATPMAAPRLYATTATAATAPAADTAPNPPSPVRKGLSYGPGISAAQPQAARFNPNGVSERSPPMYKPHSTLETPCFIVSDKFVECLVCKKRSIGYDVRGHATQDRHQDKLLDYRPVPGALSVVEAEAELEPRKDDGRRKRRKKYRKERGAAEKPAAALPATPALASTSRDEITDAQLAARNSTPCTIFTSLATS